jgi:hypothetical protein
VVRDQGALDLYACAVHGILSGPAVERLRASELKEVVITDTVRVPEEKRIPMLRPLSTAELFAGAITRIHEDRSVSELFRMLPDDEVRAETVIAGDSAQADGAGGELRRGGRGRRKRS